MDFLWWIDEGSTPSQPRAPAHAARVRRCSPSRTFLTHDEPHLPPSKFIACGTTTQQLSWTEYTVFKQTMDGLSAAASIIAVIQIAQDVGSGLKDYYECVRDARDDIQKLYRAIKSLEAILKSIQELLNLPSSQDLLCETLFTDQAGPLKQCQEELERLESELWSSGNPGKVRKAIQSLLWPFKKNDVEKRVTMLERYKSSLSLGIGLENL